MDSTDQSAERLSKRWVSLIYAFFDPMPAIETVEGRRCHLFSCSATHCKYTCRWFLNKGDAFSTGNLRKHAKTCWGEEAVKAANEAKDVSEAREKVVHALNRSGSIDAAFERKGKGKVTYSNRQHTKMEARTEI